ncbi:MAG: Sec-independent protein translocase protein TatB [Woeseiaceae bacterium]|jgi:sec-independent protein translocase protein TatB|nr:Sec-independent protein translocase protein TatB [Woeseiaceae bacterium]
MSGIGGSEFFLLCLIALLILGPERLPRVARQLGGWMGKARQMTRSLQRQLEQEVDVKKNFGFDPKDLNPNEILKQHEDDTFSPPHEEEDEDQDEAEEAGLEAEKTDENKPAS